MHRIAAKPGARKVLLMAAFAGFVVAATLSWANLPNPRPKPEWVPLLVAWGCATPLAMALAAWEYMIAGALGGSRIPFSRAIPVTVISSASNLLPVPGSIAVRTGALVSEGATPTAAFRSNLAVGVLWVGLSAAASGPVFVGNASRAAGLGVSAIGLLAIAWSVTELAKQGYRLASLAVATELGVIMVAALQMWLVARGLGFELPLAVILAYVLASVLATALGFFPAGLGIREALTALIASALGFDVAWAVFIVVGDRVVRLSALAAASAVLGWHSWSRGRRSRHVNISPP